MLSLVVLCIPTVVALHQSAGDLSIVDWSGLDTRGFVWLKDFLPTTHMATHIAHHWKNRAQPNVHGKSSSYAEDVPAIEHVKAEMGRVGAAIAASTQTELRPDPT